MADMVERVIAAFECADGTTLFVLVAPDLPENLPLTRAERAVAKQVLAGMANAAIARARGVATSTVIKQVTSIYRKMGVRSRAGLVAVLVRPAAGAMSTRGAR